MFGFFFKVSGVALVEVEIEVHQNRLKKKKDLLMLRSVDPAMPTYCTSSALILNPRLIEQGESFSPSLFISFNTSYCSINIVIPLLKKKKCIEKKKKRLITMRALLTGKL